MTIREKLSSIILKNLTDINTKNFCENYPFYYKDYNDNLVQNMHEDHSIQFSEGSGNEKEGKEDKPAKMACITSSSAMTFNILGNLEITAKADQNKFSAGKYGITYEKKMYTLNKGSSAANLDAFLKKGDEAIFCEMKMLEWLSSPGTLQKAYLDSDNYFSSGAYAVFTKLAEKLMVTKGLNSKNAYPSIFKRYDAWQMFKHTLAIYNATYQSAKDEYNKRNKKIQSMAGKLKKVSLINVVFEMDETMIEDTSLRAAYDRALNQEHNEYKKFVAIMLDPDNGLKKLFEKDCGVYFDIDYMSVHDFVACFDKTPDELNKLARYCCK